MFSAAQTTDNATDKRQALWFFVCIFERRRLVGAVIILQEELGDGEEKKTNPHHAVKENVSDTFFNVVGT